jgi:hypothetical protein
MSTKTIDPRRRTASVLAYRSRSRVFKNMSHEDDLAELAPDLSPAERTERLAELSDALALRDGIRKIADTAHHLMADQLGAIDPRLVLEAAKPAYTELIVAARLRKAISLRDFDRIAGLDQAVDHAIEFARQVEAGDVTVREVEPDLAHPEVLAEAAEEQLVGALGDLSFRAVERIDLALERLQEHVGQRVEAAFAALIGGGR